MPQPSAAVTVKVRVGAQAVPPSTWLTLMVGEVVQLSVAKTKALILTSVGRFVTLQPRLPPVGTLVNVGAAVSAVQL